MLGLRLVAEVCGRTLSQQHTCNAPAARRAIASLKAYQPEEFQAVPTVKKRGLDILHDPLYNKVVRVKLWRSSCCVSRV